MWGENRFNMLTRWLTFMTLLGSADSVTVAPTCRVKGELLVQLLLRCGEGKSAGEVQFWHTPFGDLRASDPSSDMAPVFLDHDGRLVIPSCSTHHAGLYYCIQHHPHGSTLWPYELHVGHQNQNRSREVTSRFRRSFRLGKAVVSDGLFTGAVTASVLLTFTVGFSAGALARSHVVRCFLRCRCLLGISTRLRLPRKRQTHMPDHSSQVTIATLPLVYDNQVFEAEAMNRDSKACGTPEKSVSMTTPSPPAKPKRSFRHKRHEEQEAAVDLEGRDHRQEDGEAKEKEITEDEEIESEEDEDHGEQKDGERRNERPEVAGEQEGRDERPEVAGEQERRCERPEVAGEQERRCERPEVAGEQERRCESDEEQKSTETEEKSSKNKEKTSSCVHQSNSRVIRLYQYDEHGQRFSHLPEPDCEDPEPDRRLRLRSLSQTRLNAIMAASTGPMEVGGPKQEQEGPQLFHMEI